MPMQLSRKFHVYNKISPRQSSQINLCKQTVINPDKLCNVYIIVADSEGEEKQQKTTPGYS